MHAQAIDYAMSSLHMQLSLFDGEEEPLWKDYFLLGRIHFLSRHYEDALPHLKRAKELVRVERLHNKENYGELLMTLGKCYLSLRHNKDAYATIKDLYQTIREEKDDLSLSMMLESVALIKSLLEMNQ
jgi:tetratricopeptide (TPR) repeat protein